jgi:hypothetical protein
MLQLSIKKRMEGTIVVTASNICGRHKADGKVISEVGKRIMQPKAIFQNKFTKKQSISVFDPIPEK